MIDFAAKARGAIILFRLGLVTLLIAYALGAASCGAWKPAKHEAATVEIIDSQLSSGMSVAELHERFPGAERVAGDDTNGAWFVSRFELCNRCTNRRAFQSSSDLFARIVRFENNQLVAIEAVDTTGVQQ